MKKTILNVKLRFINPSAIQMRAMFATRSSGCLKQNKLDIARLICRHSPGNEAMYLLHSYSTQGLRL